MAAPANAASHHWSRSCAPWATIEPHSAVGGRTPSPRYESEAAAVMPLPIGAAGRLDHVGMDVEPQVGGLAVAAADGLLHKPGVDGGPILWSP